MLFWRKKQREQKPREKLTPAQIVLGLLRILITNLFVIGCIYYALNAYWQWQYDRELDDIRRRGEPVTAADLRKPPISESQNAAPLVLAALRKLDTQISAADAGILSDYASGDKSGPEIERQVEAIVAPQRWRIPLLRDALRRPRCRFPVDWESGLDARLTHLKPLRRMSSVLRAEATREAQRGRPADALDLLSLHFHLSETLAHEPGLISQLCRYALLQTGFESINAVLATAHPPNAALAGLLTRLKQVSLSDSLRTALLGERVMGIICCEQFPRWLTDENTEDAGRVVLPTEGSIFALAFLHLNRLNYLRQAERFVSLSRVRYRDISPEDLRDLDDPGSSVTNLLAALLTPSGMAMAARDAAIANLTHAIIAIDLELYRRQHAGFPQSLDALREIDPALRAEDPFSGKPMRYQKPPGGYLMWSIGQDLRDDGGKPGKSSEDGDIVWEVNRDSGLSPGMAAPGHYHE